MAAAPPSAAPATAAAPSPAVALDAQPIVRQGYLERRGRLLGKWTRAYYVLRTGGLQVYLTNDISGKPQKVIPLSETSWVDEIPDGKFDKPNIFKLRTNKLDYFFACVDAAERAGWLDAIRNRQSFIPGLSRPPGSPLSLETLQGLAAPLYSARRPLVTFAQTPGAGTDGALQPTPGAPDAATAAAPTPGTAVPAAASAPTTPALPQYVPPGPPVQSAAAAVAQEEVNLQQALSEDQWNEKYQQLIDMEEATFEHAVHKGVELAALLGRFRVAVQSIGKTIIDEYHLAVSAKTIKPVPTDAPAAGAAAAATVAEQDELYICNGILFRFASDPRGELVAPGADDVAMKIAGHEIKGLRAYLEAGVVGLHTALTATIDHKGFRLIAIAVVPADGDRTLVYGLSPVLQQQDFAFVRMLKDAADELHLKEHTVIDGPRAHTISTSIDVQGHRCDDGRCYLINLAHAFPADTPQPNTGEALTNLFRPEFLRKYPHPVSSDVFYNTGGPTSDQPQNEAEALAASRFLHETIISEFVQRADAMEVFPLDYEGLAAEMHAAGINMRYLGRVAEQTRLPHLRELCVVDMVARICKRILNRNLRVLLRAQRELQLQAVNYEPGAVAVYTQEEMDQQVRLCVLDFFNLVLGAGPETDRFWYAVLVPEAKRKFRFDVNPRLVHRPALFLALQHHCGARFLDDDQYPFAQVLTPLELDHLTELAVDCKVPVNTRSDSYAFANRGLASREAGKLDDALQAFNLKLNLHKNLFGLHNVECQRILTALASIYAEQRDMDHALLCANAALGAGRRHHAEAARTYNVLTEIFYHHGDMERARECHELALQVVKWHLGPHHPLLLEVLRTMGVLYYNDKKHSFALDKFTQALDLAVKVLGTNHPTAAHFYNRCGHVYRAMQNVDMAATAYEKALLIHQTVLGPTHPTTAFSYFYMAEALTAKGQLSGAAEYSARALSVREQVLGERHPLTLNSLYQLAIVSERLNDTDKAIGLFTRVLIALKESNDEALLAQVQDVTRTIVRLKFRAMPPDRQLILTKIRRQNRHFNDYALLERVVGELYDRDPAAYVDELFARIAAMDGDAYLWLACVVQLVEDEELMLRGVRPGSSSSGAVPVDGASYAPDNMSVAGDSRMPGRSPSFMSPTR